MKRGLIFAGQRIDYKSDAWQMPQGGIELRETPRNAALRELKEETGISMQHVEILCETKGWVKYDLPKDLVPKLWGGKFVGQKQKWFLLKMLAEDRDIKLDRSSSPEFDFCKWVSYWYPLDQVVNFKRDVYLRAMKELAPFTSKCVSK